ncbi:MAG: glycosyltransferase [Planctomycetia bacterium]|nr:glycosyltransferase [Planctomycetia bacterium]
MSDRNRIPLEHLDRLTDSTGLIQHARYQVPRRESGYTTDDNARALRLCARLWTAGDDDGRMLDRAGRFLGFLAHAAAGVHGFHNFLGYQRDWLDASGTCDCHGQAFLGLAEVVAGGLPQGFQAAAWELIASSLPAVADLRSLRAQAYLIIAWGRLREAGDRHAAALEPAARQAADRLIDCHSRSFRPDWPWFESRLTYANAVLPQAMFVAGERWPHEPFLSVAAESFNFLDAATTADGVFWPVGNRDWYSHGEEKSPYDQQPVEAATMAEAALAAARHDDRHLDTFRRAAAWFTGRNSLGLPLGDPMGGGCFDGLQPEGVNRNQGAESTLAYLWTRLLEAATARRPTAFEPVDAAC